MYFSNGFACGGEPNQSVKINNMQFLPNRRILVRFNNGETKIFDSGLLSGEVYEPLKDERVLRACIIDHGVPTWCNGDVDCAPEYIYENSFECTGKYDYESKEVTQVSEEKHDRDS